MATSPQFQVARPWSSLPLLIFSKRRFIEAAIQHSMAIDLESKDIRDAYDAGTYPKSGWEVVAETDLARSTKQLRQAIWSSFVAVLLVTLLTLAAVYAKGLVSPDLPISWVKVCSAVGGFLAGWATLFALGTPAKTWKAKSLPELVHPKVFSVLFIPGLFFAFLGQLL